VRIVPKSVAGRLALLVAAAILFAHVGTAILVVLLSDRDERYLPPGSELGALLAAIRLVGAAPEGQRATLAAAVPVRGLTYLPGVAVPPDAHPIPVPPILRGLLAPGTRLVQVAGREEDGEVEDDERHETRMAVVFPDGGALLLPHHLPGEIGRQPRLWLLSVLGLAAIVGGLTLLAVRILLRPLGRLAAGVAAVAPDGSGPDLPSAGAREIARLALAVNAMRARIRGLLEDRTRMLAAVGHDLRTPITRLRLRAEEIGDARLKGEVEGDLALMERMVGSALAFLAQTAAQPPRRVPVDLPALLQTLCDDAVDRGGRAVYEGPERLSFPCDAEAIGRAAENLIDNAVKHGGGARVTLDADGSGTVEIVVEDDGPGIPEDEIAGIADAFRRGDRARTLGPRSGFGLGLAIAGAAAKAHGGELRLANRPEGGLSARLVLPLPAATGATSPGGLSPGREAP
jgi:signal transduction histidine kinase